MQRLVRRAKPLVVSVGAALLAAGALSSALGQGERRSVRDGVFSAEQVARGERTFDRVCLDCHEIEEFTGRGAYLDDVEGRTVWQVFDYIWAEMPEDRPSSLEPEEYADVLSYLFSVYGLPAGPEPLPTTRAELRRITIEPPELPGS